MFHISDVAAIHIARRQQQCSLISCLVRLLVAANLIISVLVSYLKTIFLSDCVLIEVVDNIMAETDVQAFFNCFWSTPGTD